MKYIPILIIALMIATIFPCVGAENVTYPQGYYDLNKQANDLWAQQNQFSYNYYSIKSVWLKLSANQIALEKQNELISEQNELLRKLMNQTYTGKPMDSNGKLVIGGGYYSYIQPNN
jgi:hypothetical protein